VLVDLEDCEGPAADGKPGPPLPTDIAAIDAEGSAVGEEGGEWATWRFDARSQRPARLFIGAEPRSHLQ
jgi:hypothetical protein